jgi:predicted nucleotidyltransferase
VASSGPTDAVSAALQADPLVRSVSLVGSRADGTATTLSDWDYHVSSSDPATVSLRLPDLTRPLRPLSQLWDPLARHPGYMLIVAPPPDLTWSRSIYYLIFLSGVHRRTLPR